MREPVNLESITAQLKLLCSEVKALRKRLDIQNRYVAPATWGLTKRERLILGVLMERDSASTDALMIAVYGARGWRDKDQPDPAKRIINVFISTLRPKLRRHGVFIKYEAGVYYMEAESKALAVKLRIEAGVPPVDPVEEDDVPMAIGLRLDYPPEEIAKREAEFAAALTPENAQ